MSLSEEIVLVVVDKLLIGGILGAAALYVSSRLERRKAADELKGVCRRPGQGLPGPLGRRHARRRAKQIGCPESLRKWYAEAPSSFRWLLVSSFGRRDLRPRHPSRPCQGALSRLRMS
jgi:hypothetical protein